MKNPGFEPKRSGDNEAQRNNPALSARSFEPVRFQSIRVFLLDE